jgi:hypothetical protein
MIFKIIPYQDSLTAKDIENILDYWAAEARSSIAEQK